jgi:hypothetical protein
MNQWRYETHYQQCYLIYNHRPLTTLGDERHRDLGQGETMPDC